MTHSCPICGKPSALPFRPFCSGRCADVDLGRWLTGQYRIPATEETADEDEEDEAGPLDRDRGMG